MLNRSGSFILSVILVATALSPKTRADSPPATQPAGIEFLSGQAAKDAIIDDSADPYFSKLEEHEMTAKTSSPITGTTHADKIAECKKRYQAATTDFTDDEKATLTFFIEKIQGPLKRDYPVFGNTPWSFIKVKDTLEGGMPHTRGGHIVMPAGVLADFVKYKKRMGANAIPAAASLLIHEQTHVLERQHPDLFQPLFTDTLHFIHAGKIESNPWLTDRQLINPDGTVCDWIYPLTENGKPSYMLPLIAFDDPNPTDLRHGIGMIAVTMEKTPDGFKPAIGTDGNPVVRPLSDVTQYMQGPGSESDNYHPNEIAADRFAELVVVDDLWSDQTRKKVLKINGEKLDARLKPTRDWAATAFAKK
jgi:hypothetical protein